MLQTEEAVAAAAVAAMREVRNGKPLTCGFSGTAPPADYALVAHSLSTRALEQHREIERSVQRLRSAIREWTMCRDAYVGVRALCEVAELAADGAEWLRADAPCAAAPCAAELEIVAVVARRGMELG